MTHDGRPAEARPRTCLVCADELPPAAYYLPWLCPECLVATDADAIRPRPADFTSALGRVGAPVSGS
jgi:hypothetical protein